MLALITGVAWAFSVKDFTPSISLNVFLGGFSYYKDYERGLKSLLQQFVNEKHMKRMEIALKIEVHDLLQDSVKSYNEVSADLAHISPDSDFVNWFSEYHSKFRFDQSGGVYSLFIMNHENNSLTYGSSDQQNNCFILDCGAFCHIKSANHLQEMLKYTTDFIDQVILPDTESVKPAPERVIIPVISFGPHIKSSVLQKKLRNLFPSVDVLVLVNRQNVYDFPIVATSQLSTRVGTLFDALRKSEHVFGATISSSNPGTFPVYVFASSTKSSIEISENVGIVFGREDDIQSLILTAAMKLVCGFANNITFGGHHPLYPHGGATSFSSVIVESVTRSWALGNVGYAADVMERVEAIRDQIKAMRLEFMNFTIDQNSMSELEKMLKRTSKRISENELVKAVSSSGKAVQIADELLKRANEKLFEAHMFGQCCPETVYVSQRRLSPVVIYFVLGAFLVTVVVMAYYFWSMYKKKMVGVPVALMFAK